MMVSISVIAVLIGILAPALAGARREALRTKCLAQLKNLGQLVMVYAQQRQGRLPDLADPRANLPQWSAKDTTNPYYQQDDPGQTRIVSYYYSHRTGYLIHAVETIDHWSHPLWVAAGQPAGMRTYEVLTCPVVFRRFKAALEREVRKTNTLGDPAPYVPARLSYAYSPALFSEAAAWTGSGPVDVNRAEKPVLIDSVAHPSQKTALIESSSHHERSPAPLFSWSRGRVNVLAVDGHAQSLAKSQARDGMVIVDNPLTGPNVPWFVWGGKATPALTTAQGSLGRDW